MMEFSLEVVGLALSALAVLVLFAQGLRRYVPALRSLYIPNAVAAGVLGLALGPQVLGRVVDRGRLSEGLWGEEMLAVWSALPGLLINVVFAAILLGKAIPSLRSIWDQSASQAMFGATLSFGQYALGLILAFAVLVPVFDMNELSGGLLEISFTGGHGTAAGLSEVMTSNGFEDGPDLALGLATVGLLGGILAGTILVNRAVRSDKIVIARNEEVESTEEYDIDLLEVYEGPVELEPDPATSPLTVTVGVISVAIGLGWLLQQALIGVEVLISGNPGQDTFMADIPLFPFTIIGGAAIQLLLVARGWAHLVPRRLVNQAAGLALDLLIAAAIATLSLSTLGSNIVPFVLMVVVAMGWSVLALLYLAPRFYGRRWFERGIGDFGQSSGTVASGFLLTDMADPAATSGARDSYGYKQLLFEPFLGGGVVTALSLPLIVRVGAGWSAVGATVLTVVFIGLGIRRAPKS